MQEIKCPKCGEVFQVDESGYASIVKQVRDREFQKELDSHRTQLEKERETAVELAKAKTAEELNARLAESESKILRLQSELDRMETEKKLAVNEAVADKENEIAKKGE